MKFTSKSLLLTLAAFSLHAQEQEEWRWQNPWPQPHALSGVHAFDQNTAIAVGSLGTILKTTDGGRNWSVQHNVGGPSIYLNSVSFFDRNNGLAVGLNSSYHGIILKTSDGGSTWSSRAIQPGAEEFEAVHFFDANNGWIAGWDKHCFIINCDYEGIIWRTTNGGQSWSQMSISSAGDWYLYGIHFAHVDTGWAVGSGGRIFKTVNGGASWAQQATSTTSSLEAVFFVNTRIGWAAGGSGTILKTTNGGATWSSQTGGTSRWLYAVSFADANVGWAVGDNGLILKTTNGGLDWFVQTSNTMLSLLSVSCFDAQSAWTAGASGLVLKTANGGTAWPAQSKIATTNQLNAVHFAQRDTGWAVGAGGTILNTTNGGVDWTKQTSSTTSSLNAVIFIKTKTGWAAGSSGMMLRTSDGGNTWTAQSTGASQALHALAFVDANLGWAVGANGTILKTTNRGDTWIPQISGVTNALYAATFSNANSGWAVGANGTLLQTGDGGNTWLLQTSGTVNTLYDVVFVDTNLGWAVGAQGTILNTGDGGTTWSPQPTGATNDLRTVEIIRAGGLLYGWAAGTDGALLKLVNEGNNWSIKNSGAPNDLFALDLIAQSGNLDGWVVGEAGNILYSNLAIATDLLVWPGDTDNNGVVNAADVLALGLYWNQTGPARSNASMNWVGQAATPWQTEAATFADANGDSTVNQQDVLALGLNWGKTHTTLTQQPKRVPLALSKSGAAQLYCTILPPAKENEASWIEIYAGGASNLFGLAFEVQLPEHASWSPIQIEPGHLLGEDLLLYSHIDRSAGKVGVGLTRKAGAGGITGSGMVARIKMQKSGAAVVDELACALQNVVANDPSGFAIPFVIGNTTGVEEAQHLESLPTVFALKPNHPNPFNPATTISYDLPQAVEVKLEIFDVLGRRVRTLVQQRQPAGRYTITWNGRNEQGRQVASGVFIYKLSAGDFVQSRRMAFVR